MHSATCHVALEILYHKEKKMNIEKLLFLIYLMLFVCVFEELLLAILIAIAIYLGVVIIKELKDLN